VANARALRLLFVTEGEGTIAGVQLRRWSAVRLAVGETAQLRATGGLEVLQLCVRPVADLPLGRLP